MRDPWIPLIFMLMMLLAIWLGIIGPLPSGVADWVQKWQSLVAAVVALIAASVAFYNTTRSLRQAEALEKHRRSRKHAAVRAVLSLALAQVTYYAEQSAHALKDLSNKCNDEILPTKAATEKLIQPLPSETLKTFAEFIEYSEVVDAGIIELTAASIQIHDSRLRGLVRRNRDPTERQFVLRSELEDLIIDAAEIYAGSAAVFNYARRRQSRLPRTLSRDAVRNALRNMLFWDDEYPRLQDILANREYEPAGPL